MKKNNDFLYCINPRCTIDELKTLMKSYNIDFFNEEILVKKFFFDNIEYLIFDSELDRKEFNEKLDSAPNLKQNISEIIYIDKSEYLKYKNEEKN